MQLRIPKLHRSARGALVVLALLASALACAIAGRGGAKVPPQQWDEERGPVVPHDTFPRDCSLCHEGPDWHSIRSDFAFDHGQETGVPLAGAHARAACLRCHNDRGPVAVFAARGCAGCHEDVHRARLGSNCTDCHDEHDWEPRGQIAMHQRTRFPLVGAHAATECVRCHEGAPVGNFDRTSTLCVDCHRDDLARATEPDHAAQGWTSACDRCHIPTTWDGAGFNHPGFPLTGGHARLDCAQCHAGGVFRGLSRDCASCHQDDYAATTRPSHVAAGFPTTCARCHSTSAWTPASFDHSGFALTGAHASASCNACHGGGVYRGLPTNCIACHQDDWDGTTDPDHQAAGFPTTCQTCHTTSAWEGATFNHSFPITSGRHARFDCAQCHTTPGNFRAFTCTDCHAHTQRDMNDEHDRVPGYTYSTPACYQCHPDGRK